uniref:Uncharacterized protein n=1 Tax=Rhizophora mucronata TaxID=61149 RepID=A0A2P2QVZ0_RHIMU
MGCCWPLSRDTKMVKQGYAMLQLAL